MAAGSGRPPRWLKPLNRVLLAVQRLGLGLRELPVLTVPGRSSGTPRRTPLTVLDLDGERYLLQGYPRADWVANLRAAGHLATLGTGKHPPRVRLVELPAEQARPVLRAWPVRVPDGAKIMKDAGVVADLRPETFEAQAGRLAVFRIEPA